MALGGLFVETYGRNVFIGGRCRDRSVKYEMHICNFNQLNDSKAKAGGRFLLPER